jgi:uncharacterized protein YmfQ (DUF2313 family)
VADSRDFFVKDLSNAPLTGAAGSFTAIARDLAAGVRTPPAIVELGEGNYRVTVTDADEAIGTVVHIDLGAGRSPRRVTFACFKADRSNQFWALHVENPDGTLWAGAPPTVGSYRASAGTRTPPTPVALAGAYLWALVPTNADMIADVAIRIDGPAGSAQPEWLGVTRPVVAGGSAYWLPGTPTPVPDLSSATLFDRMAYVRQLKALLPPGVLYNVEPDSTLSKLFEGIADELTRINARGVDLINESDPRTATETLAEWEEVVGLPDELVTAIPATTAERRVAITQKYISRGGQNYGFFETLCAACGYPLVSISLYVSQVLRVGFRVRARVYGLNYAFTMHVTVGNIVWMDRLTTAQFEAVIRHATHAHIRVVFTYV